MTLRQGQGTDLVKEGQHGQRIRGGRAEIAVSRGNGLVQQARLGYGRLPRTAAGSPARL